MLVKRKWKVKNQVQRIKEEVERRNKWYNEELKKYEYPFMVADLAAKEEESKSILSFIDSMQEEPSPVWHDVSEEPDEQRELLCEWDSEDATWHEVAFYHADTQDYWNYTSKVEGVTKWAYIDDLLSIKEEDPVSEDLEEEAEKCIEGLIPDTEFNSATPFALEYVIELLHKAFKAGANWQKEFDDTIIKLAKAHYWLLGKIQMKKEFEKNRLAACDRQTEEEAEVERDFAISIIEKEHRQPTFDDAIKYGMKLQKERMMKDAVDITLDKADRGTVDLKVALDDVKNGDKLKIIVIKED